MAFGINKKLKVVWLCHYANQEMFEHFNISNGKEFAPWISLLIDLFKSERSVELHIVAPNVYSNEDSSFIKNGIHFHFYEYLPKFPIFNKYFREIYYILRIDQISNYSWVKHKISSIVNSLKPDIVHLHGAENPYYSAGILPIIDKYPQIVTIQGFIKQSIKRNWEIKQRIQIEEEIIKKCKHFGTRTDDMNKVVLDMNPNAILHYHFYPIELPKVFKSNIGGDEPIDCIFFARVCKDKGIEDLLHAIVIIKQKIPNIYLTVIGSVSSLYLNFLMQMCKKLNIKDNVHFLGFQKTQNDVYQYAINAKICVLPTYHDIIPGTIIESMFLKLPVVAYAVGGIPDLNRNNETVKLVEKLNTEKLAEAILSLLLNVDCRRKLAEKAYIWANERINNSAIVGDVFKAYASVLSD